MASASDSRRIAFVSAELAPLAKAGGLADVSAALPRYLHSAGHDLRLFVPLYARIIEARNDLVPVEFVQDVSLHLGPHRYQYSLYTGPQDESGLAAYFVHCPVLYGRDSLYTSDPDEHLRFALLCRAAIESCQRMGFAPDVFHCNDWQTALVPLYLKALYHWDQLFAKTRTLLTIHNIGYQGVFGTQAVSDLGLSAHAGLLHQEDLRAGHVNFLKTGLLYADGLTTVSPTYAREIQTAEHGAGLDSMLRARSDRLVGILNGVDYTEWSPEHDTLLPATFTRDDLTGKRTCKDALLSAMGLRPAPEAPLIGMVTRLTAQKGIDLLFETLPRLLRRRDMRLTVLGSGEAHYEAFFAGMQRAFPGRVCYYRGYSNDLAHLIEAGADMFLMPSQYEPCGLNQMYSLRYGTAPIVRRTGGLADTVQLYDPASGAGTGIVFEHYDTHGVDWALRNALALYARPEHWRRLVRNAMSCDYSWDRQGAIYEELYRRLAAL